MRRCGVPAAEIAVVQTDGLSISTRLAFANPFKNGAGRSSKHGSVSANPLRSSRRPTGSSTTRKVRSRRRSLRGGRRSPASSSSGTSSSPELSARRPAEEPATSHSSRCRGSMRCRAISPARRGNPPNSRQIRGGALRSNRQPDSARVPSEAGGVRRQVARLWHPVGRRRGPNRLARLPARSDALITWSAERAVCEGPPRSWVLFFEHEIRARSSVDQSI